MNVYFRSSSVTNKSIARAVCLDTEPKVIRSCVQHLEKSGAGWQYDPRNIAYRHSGAGNNWALGYQMAGGEFCETSLDMIRRELEVCDWPVSLLCLQSLGGGTGSGLGTYLTEACSDEFPDTSRTNLAIAPYHFGEVTVQVSVICSVCLYFVICYFQFSVAVMAISLCICIRPHHSHSFYLNPGLFSTPST
jgi:tubulin delta